MIYDDSMFMLDKMYGIYTMNYFKRIIIVIKLSTYINLSLTVKILK